MEASGNPSLASADQGDEPIAPHVEGRRAATRRFLVMEATELSCGGIFLAGVDGDVVASAGVPIQVLGDGGGRHWPLGVRFGEVRWCWWWAGGSPAGVTGAQ
jgi:hypothetical protein